MRMSDRERAFECDFVHSGTGRGIGDLAAVHHHEMIAELLGKVETL